MTTNALAVNPPAELSKGDIWKKCVSLARTNAKEKAAEIELAASLYDVGTVAGTAVAAGFLFQRFPMIAVVGPVPVQPVIGVIALIFGVFTKGFVADRAKGVGYGLLIPYLYEQGAEYATS